MKCSTKNEWVLDGDTVLYGGAAELRETLEYDLAVERDFSYAGLTMQEVIRHLTRFISRVDKHAMLLNILGVIITQ